MYIYGRLFHTDGPVDEKIGGAPSLYTSVERTTPHSPMTVTIVNHAGYRQACRALLCILGHTDYAPRHKSKSRRLCRIVSLYCIDTVLKPYGFEQACSFFNEYIK